MLIQIYGERCSGTGFLMELLKKNALNEVTNGAKHSFPRVNNTSDNILYICIFRDLESWLKSIWKNPYHLKINHQFNDFLLNKQKSQVVCINKKKKDCLELCCNDQGKTIFEIRNNKIEKHLVFYHKQQNVIHLSLDFLQKDAMFFLHVLKHVYNINLVDNLDCNIPYTKRLRKKVVLDKYKNRIYNEINMKKYKNIINKHKNDDFEKYINSLKILCKKDNVAIF